MRPPAIAELARLQLEAYNASDLDTFCSYYHPQVVVMTGESVDCEGLGAFRRRYEGLFGAMTFGGEVPERLSAGDHCVDLENWWRVDPASGARSEGQLLVRFTLREGLIGRVQFLP